MNSKSNNLQGPPGESRFCRLRRTGCPCQRKPGSGVSAIDREYLDRLTADVKKAEEEIEMALKGRPV